MRRRPRGSGTIRKEGAGYAIIYGSRQAAKYESGFPNITAAEERLALIRADAIRPPPPPPPPTPPPAPVVVLVPKRIERQNRCRPFKDSRLPGGCEVCGWKAPPPLTARALQVHHVKQVKDGGDDSDSNLLLLCPNHHALVHAAYRYFPGLTSREAIIEKLRIIDRPRDAASEAQLARSFS